MNRALLGGVAALALIIAGQAFAQTVKLEPEDRSKIKKHMLNSKGAAVTIIDRPMVGAKLHMTVPLMAVPPDWGRSVAKFNYILTPVPTISSSGITYNMTANNNQIVLVDPSNREIVEIIKE